jgi:hypothetical protein
MPCHPVKAAPRWRRRRTEAVNFANTNTGAPKSSPVALIEEKRERSMRSNYFQKAGHVHALLLPVRRWQQRRVVLVQSTDDMISAKSPASTPAPCACCSLSARLAAPCAHHGISSSREIPPQSGLQAMGIAMGSSGARRRRTLGSSTTHATERGLGLIQLGHCSHQVLVVSTSCFLLSDAPASHAAQNSDD